MSSSSTSDSSDDNENVPVRSERTLRRRRALKRARLEGPVDCGNRDDGSDISSNHEQHADAGAPTDEDYIGPPLQSSSDSGNERPSNQDSEEESESQNSSGSESGSNHSDFFLHHLDEMQLDEHDAYEGHAENPGGPDDPDDPDDPSNYLSDETEESSDEETPTINVSAHELGRQLVFTEPMSAGNALFLHIAKNLRHKETYESLIDSLINDNTVLGGHYLPSSKKQLWRVLGRSDSGLVKHAYCGKCGSYLKKLKKIKDSVKCGGCGENILKLKAKYFVTLSIKKQLEQILATPGIAEQLKYRENRKKFDENAIEDVFDGTVYKQLESEGVVGNGSPNLTYAFSTDGVKQSLNASTQIYPVFLRINEFPPALRQKYMILAAVYVDKNEPQMATLLEPVVENLNKLQQQGVKWKPVVNGPTVESKLFPLCCCVDGKARGQVYNIVSHSGYYGCTYCTFKGVCVNRTVRWPYLPHEEIPPYEERTHDGMLRDMQSAYSTNKKLREQGKEIINIKGHKGLSALALLHNFDLRMGNAVDDLHVIYECAAKHITELTLTEAPRIPAGMGYPRLCEIIDQRMAQIKTPSTISRKPGTSSVMKRANWTGTEWRNWLIYFGLPCMSGLIDPTNLKIFQYLSRGTYLCSLDSITEAHLTEADNCFRMFLTKNEECYGGVERSKLNLHTLIHVTKSVRDLGPLFTYSTFNFESLNHKIIQLITSPKGSILQIVWRHLLYLAVYLKSHAEDVPDLIKQRMQQIMSKKRLVRAQKMMPSVYVVGDHTLRAPTAEERQVLQNENIQNVNLMKVYEKIIVKSVRYRTAQEISEGKSDDSMIYTYIRTFCTIKNIVVFNQGEEELCGLFVIEHAAAARAPFNAATHLTSILPPEHDLLHFIKPMEIRSPVVKMFLPEKNYVAPLPNHFEID